MAKKSKKPEKSPRRSLRRGEPKAKTADAAAEWLAANDPDYEKPKEDRADVAHDDARDGAEDKALHALIDGTPRRGRETLDRQLHRTVRRALVKSKIDVSKFTARRRRSLQSEHAKIPIGPEPWQAKQGGSKDRPRGGRDRAPLVRLIVLLSTVDVLQMRRHLSDLEMALVTMALGFWPSRVTSVAAALRARVRYVARRRRRFRDRT